MLVPSTRTGWYRKTMMSTAAEAEISKSRNQSFRLLALWLGAGAGAGGAGFKSFSGAAASSGLGKFWGIASIGSFSCRISELQV
jgi:hypothetical protein